MLASDGRLTYFKDDSKHKKRGELVLQHGTKCGPHGKDDFAFFLKTPSGKRTWIFAASSAEERDLWIESMELIVTLFLDFVIRCLLMHLKNFIA